MGKGAGWQDRLRYRFDRLLSRGSAATIGWVVGLAIALATVGGIVFWLLGLDFGGRSGLAESFWQAFLIAIGSGGILDDGWGPRLITFVFVFAGVFLTGSLIGVLVAAVNKRVDELRRGRGRVLESGHTVVLGWSPRLMAVLDELLDETPSKRGVRVVVLADRDKQEMEDAFRAKYRGKERSQVLFRSGDPANRTDLELVGLDHARAVVVLSEGSFVDATAVRRALAAHTAEPDDAHVVVEIGNPRVARSLTTSTGGSVAVVSVDDVVADMLAQSVRRPQLARVFDQLLSYGGSELYVVPAAELAGEPFWDAVRRVDEMAIVGILDSDGAPTLLPPGGLRLRSSDRLVAIAPDKRPPEPRSNWYPDLEVAPDVPDPTRALLIGWNDCGGGMLDRLADYVPEESLIEVLADVSMLDDGPPDWRWPFSGGFTHTKHGPSQVLETIRRIRPEVIVVLGYSDGVTHSQADALTLLTLLTLERAREAGEIPDCRVVAQLFDRELAPLADNHVRDGGFIITDALASRLLVHASRDLAVAAAYRELFDAAGPIVDFFDVGAGTTTYGSAVSSLATHGIVAIGAVIDGAVLLTPPHTSTLTLGGFDRIIGVRPTRLTEVNLEIEYESESESSRMGQTARFETPSPANGDGQRQSLDATENPRQAWSNR